MRVRTLLTAPLLAAGLVSLTFVGTGGSAARPAAGTDVTSSAEPAPDTSSYRVGEATPVDGALAPGASVFVPIPAYRMYDSRQDPAGIWIEGDNMLLDALANLHGTPKIPPWASAVAFNITVTQTVGAGFVQVYGPGVVPFTTSTVNWVVTGLDIANSGSSQLGWADDVPGLMGVALGGNGAAAHVIIDITGYYELMPPLP